MHLEHGFFTSSFDALPFTALTTSSLLGSPTSVQRD
jgi:hypothetical protein